MKLCGRKTLSWISTFMLTGLLSTSLQAKELHLVLMGASIGREWNVPQLPERMKLEHITFEYIGVFDQFDKTVAINEIISRKLKPDVVIIKQCSVYFPGALTQYKILTQTWVKNLRDAGIRPVLATSVPIARSEAIMDKIKDVARIYILQRKPKMEQIEAFNDWIRQFSDNNGLAVLDLEKTLRISASDRYMRPDFDKGDRVHINQKAYAALDNIMPHLLNEMMAETTPVKGKKNL